MKITDILKILRKKFPYLLLFPLMLACIVFYKTRDEEKEYSSRFLVYTGIASGYNLTTEEHPRIDHNAVNNAFDNLLTTLQARETIEEVSIRLLTTHLRMEKPDPRIISNGKLYRVRELFPDSMETKVKKAATFEDAVAIMTEYLNSPGTNAVKSFVNSPFEVYGVEHITESIKAERKDFSDMLEVSFSSNDPGICQQTLQILSEVFVRRYREIKKGEITNVLGYYEEQTSKSLNKLRAAEENLKEFEVANKIINFEEETKSISDSKQDLMNNIEKEKLTQSSAQATVKNLESKLDIQKGLMETNQKILEKRHELAEMNYKIANSQLYKNRPAELAQIKEEAESLKEEIKIIVNDLYKLNNSTEGLPKKDLLTQWMNNMLVLDESTVRLQILEQKLKEYDSMYNKYAPMGSTLNRLKREIEVAEKEYLGQLNGLNVNKQRQQNIELASTIRVVDKPYYPLSPKPSKRNVLIAGSFVAGLVLIFGFFISLEFFDTKINTPVRAETLTGLRIAGALPFVRKKENRFNVEYLESSLMEQAISTIALEIRQTGAEMKKTKFIMVTSPKSGEGKTWCANRLASQFSEANRKVLLLYPESMTDNKISDNEYTLFDSSLITESYSVNRNFLSMEDPAELVGETDIKLEDYNYVIIEIPSLSDNQLPVGLVNKMQMGILVVRADRKWSENDNFVTKLYKKACSSNCGPMVILNRVSPDGLNEIFGEMPKARRKVKKTKQEVKNSDELQGDEMKGMKV